MSEIKLESPPEAHYTVYKLTSPDEKVYIGFLGWLCEKVFIYLLDVYTKNSYNLLMIKSFADKETEKIYNQIFSRKLPQDIQRIALRKLIMIDNAGQLEDLRVPPANHLEALQGDRVGQYSIRINDQYRICFSVEGKNDFLNVEIVDYH